MEINLEIVYNKSLLCIMENVKQLNKETNEVIKIHNNVADAYRCTPTPKIT